MGQIQRIQSVYLFIAAVLCGLTFLFDLYEASAVSGAVEVVVATTATVARLAGGEVQKTPHYGLIAVAAFNTVFPILIVFFYNNRMLQVKLSSLAMVLFIAQVGLSFYRINDAQSGVLGSITEMDHVYLPGYFFPLGAILMLILARRSIMKDEKLVRSANRLR